MIVFTVGCSGGGNKPTEATGTVSYQGKTVGIGTITFINDKGEKATGTITDGKFTVPNSVVGEVKVVVNTLAPVKAFEKLDADFKDKGSPLDALMKDRQDKKSDDKFKKDDPIPAEFKAKMPPEQRAMVEQYEYYQKLRAAKDKDTLIAVPKKYESAETTPLKIKITSGQKEPITIDLVD